MTDQLEFLIFCIEIYKSHCNTTGKKVLNTFQKYGADDYLEEFYDVLSSESPEYICEVIDEYLAGRDVNIRKQRKRKG